MILFMRHGETTANAGGYLAGEKDVPLSEKGKQQAIEAAKDPIVTGKQIGRAHV